MRVRKKMAFIIIAICIAVFCICGACCNRSLELNTYVAASDGLPDGFDGYRIVHISDLHNTEMGKDNEKLLRLMKAADPDMIAITGDLIDSRRTDVDIALSFVEKAMDIAPCYYVTGNHEQRTEAYSRLKAGLKEAGVEVLDNRQTMLRRDNVGVALAGVDDPTFAMDSPKDDPNQIMAESLEALIDDDAGYTILLSHKPELFDVYVQSGIDLVLCGHAHGGQMQLPLIGGIFSPGEGFFPAYYEGIYKKADTQMVVSRGLGNSLFPFRINNRPEVALVVLKSEKD